MYCAFPRAENKRRAGPSLAQLVSKFDSHVDWDHAMFTARLKMNASLEQGRTT